MKTKQRRAALFLVLAMMLGLIPMQSSMAKTKAELTKIGATAKLSDDWVLIDTELSNKEIMKLLDIDNESAIASIRAQWERSSAKIEYDIVIPDEASDILINTADASGSDWQEGNELPDDTRESLMQSVKAQLKAQGAVVSEMKESNIGGQFGWKIQMSFAGTEVYEYQVLHQGKYVTISINENNGKLSQKKKEFLDEFIRDLVIRHESSSDSVSATTGNQQKKSENMKTLVIWLLIGIGGGAVLLTAIVSIVVVIVKKKKDLM